MKQKVLFVVMVLFLVFACKRNELEITNSSELLSSAEEIKSISFINSSYVIIDTPSWRNLSGDGKLKACQLSDLILDTISTENLVKTCFNYPLYFEFSLTNTSRNQFPI